MPLRRVNVWWVAVALGCAHPPPATPLDDDAAVDGLTFAEAGAHDGDATPPGSDEATPDVATTDAADAATPADAGAEIVDAGTDAAATDSDGQSGDAPVDSAADVKALTQCPAAALPDWATPTGAAEFWPSARCAKPGWVGLPATATPVFADIGTGAWPAMGATDPCALWDDLDGDGKADFATVQLPTSATGPRHLWVLLEAAGAAVPVTTALPPMGAIHDCVAGDLDGDGLPEIVLGADINSRILHNVGAGGFADATQAWKADAMEAIPLGAVALLDADRDGDLDLYLGRLIPGVGVKQVAGAPIADLPYLQVCAGSTLPAYDAACAQLKAGTQFVYSCCTTLPTGAPDLVLRNDGGQFFDASATWGLTDPGNTLALTVADLDGDGWQDVFVGNDFGAHGWYHNMGGGPFSYLTTTLHMRPYGHVMGSVFGDFDGDHRADLFISEAGPTTFYVGLPDGTFANGGGSSGVWAATEDSLSWALVGADFDQDGWLDIAQMRSIVVTPGGFAYALKTGKDPPFTPGSHLILHNDGGSFTPIALPWPTGGIQTVQAEAATAADVDGDGDLDLITTTAPGILHIYRNDTPTVGHALRVRLGGPASAAEGAHVQIWAQGYAQERVRTTSSGTGSKQSPVLHFGLGSVKQVDLVRVTWPSGKQVELGNVKADQLIVVTPP